MNFLLNSNVIFEDSIIFKKMMEGNDPDPSFAFQSTIHFIECVKNICENPKFLPKLDKIQTQTYLDDEECIFKSFKSFLMSLNFIQTLQVFSNQDEKYCHHLIRESIPCWYYSIYHSLISVIKLFSENNSPESHKSNINFFTENISNYYPDIIKYTIKDLNDYDKKIELYIKNENYTYKDIKYKPKNYEDSIGGYFCYFNGTCKYLKDKAMEEIKTNKKLNIQNFRTKLAKDTLKDNLKKKTCSFYDLSFRFRGKAHYRDSIYLCLIKPFHYKSINTFLNNVFIISKKISIINRKIIQKKLGRKKFIFESYFKEAKEHTNINKSLLEEIYES